MNISGDNVTKTRRSRTGASITGDNMVTVIRNVDTTRVKLTLVVHDHTCKTTRNT